MNIYNGQTVNEIHVFAGVRYWDDATVNGKEDYDGAIIPCRDGDMWCPVIDVATGTITNWTIGTTADIHFKVCDECGYKLIGENGDVLYECENEYVPKILCPNRDGYGDYIIMTIDGDGVISNWNPTFEDIGNEDDN